MTKASFNQPDPAIRGHADTRDQQRRQLQRQSPRDQLEGHSSVPAPDQHVLGGVFRSCVCDLCGREHGIRADLFYALSPNQIQGVVAQTEWLRFLNDFFFSAHTLSTVGYGNLAPSGITANAVAAFEAMVGLMGFALATGLLFGRVSRPSARIGFSQNMLVAPFQEVSSLQFRVVNLRSNTLIDLEASVMLMTVEGAPGKLARQYKALALERSNVYFFPLTWTIVHPIDESSPLFGKTAAELERVQAEVLILIKAFDDTFSQTVNARYSYRYDEFVWDAKFGPAFHIDGEGQIVLEVDQVGRFAPMKALADGRS